MSVLANRLISAFSRAVGERKQGHACEENLMSASPEAPKVSNESMFIVLSRIMDPLLILANPGPVPFNVDSLNYS